jgi:hypothetical protein
MEFSEELLEKLNTNHGISYTQETVNGDNVLCFNDERSFAGKDPETVLRDVAEAAGELDQSIEDCEITINDYPSIKD